MTRIFIVGILTLLTSFHASAQSADISRDVLTNPNLSLRCKDLMQERTDKIKIRQKLNDLLARNQKLLKQMPPERESTRKRLESNQISVRNELYLADLQIQSMEETIIRSGCPGIKL